MSEVDDIARNAIEDAKRLHPHQRELMNRIAGSRR